MKLTPWFKHDKPVRDGWYECLESCLCCIRMLYWKNGKWQWQEHGHSCFLQSQIWRGLAEPPTKAKAE